jgi:hypothetical protein
MDSILRQLTCILYLIYSSTELFFPEGDFFFAKRFFLVLFRTLSASCNSRLTLTELAPSQREIESWEWTNEVKTDKTLFFILFVKEEL